MPQTVIQKYFTPTIVGFVFMSDRITKYLIREYFFLGEFKHVLPIFDLTYVENRGAAFGMGQNYNSSLLILSAIVLGILIFFRRKWEAQEPLNWKLKWGFALVIGGALGNLYDRIVFGSVIDFLDFYIFKYHWPAFNVADSSICIGAFLLVISQWKQGPPNSPESAQVR